MIGKQWKNWMLRYVCLTQTTRSNTTLHCLGWAYFIEPSNLVITEYVGSKSFGILRVAKFGRNWIMRKKENRLEQEGEISTLIFDDNRGEKPFVLSSNEG